MQIHASCAALGEAAVLVTGPPGSGKSDLVLRLLDRGFALVADDQVIVEHGTARAPPSLAGLLEVRGLGIVRLDHVAQATLRLLVRLDTASPRLPTPIADPTWGLPAIALDPWHASAASRVALALRCATGAMHQHTGAFAA